MPYAKAKAAYWTTNEGMDAIGQREAIAVHAVVLLVKGGGV
ncbi:MAG: hypothetical protein WCO45_17195 [Pseudanabaena sp. ELA607]